MKLAVTIILFAVSCGSSPRSGAVANVSTRPTPWQPPGTCVEPTRDAGTRIADQFKMSDELRGELVSGLAPRARPDVDGDGAPDAVFAYAAAEVPYSLVYLTRGACGHLVASVYGDITVTESRTNGLADLTVTDWGDAEAVEQRAPAIVTRLVFDGAAYKKPTSSGLVR